MPVPASEIKFSILILSIPSRFDSLKSAITHLQKQADATGQGKSVEILALLDNRSKSISEKRNDLLRMARGKYIAFLDDDDAVSKDYMSKILEAIDTYDVDCISFNQWCSLDGQSMDVEFGIGNPHGQLWRNDLGMLGDIKRPPYHMCLWRREIAQSESFNPVYGENGQSTEDIDWLIRLYPKIQTEHHIDDYLHGYIYNSKTTTSLVPQEQQFGLI
jgi:glycosyltransferase involved in cell wall biosynthesis